MILSPRVDLVARHLTSARELALILKPKQALKSNQRTQTSFQKTWIYALSIPLTHTSLSLSLEHTSVVVSAECEISNIRYSNSLFTMDMRFIYSPDTYTA